MAKPDLDEGYLRVAHELFAAIAMAGFSKWEMVVLREVLDQIYGPKKTQAARLSPTDVASRAGTYKESIVRAIRTLVDSGVLVKIEGGEYRFVKDYESWTHNGKPRYSPPESAYCRSAKRIKTSNVDGNNGAPSSKFVGNNGAPRREQMRSPAGTDALPGGNRCAPREVVPPRPPIEERVRSGEEERKGEGEEGVVRGASDFPPVPPDDGPLMIMPGSHPMARPDAEDIWRRLWRGWEDHRLCAGFFEHQQWFPADIWRLAISEVASGNARPRSIAYFEQRCGDIQANGPKKAPTIQPARASPRNAVVTSPEMESDFKRKFREMRESDEQVQQRDSGCGRLAL